jgi:protein tyrosine phosphatase
LQIYLDAVLKDPSAFRLQYVEKKSESDSFFGDYDSAIKPINRGKNRYSNVLPRA